MTRSVEILYGRGNEGAVFRVPVKKGGRYYHEVVTDASVEREMTGEKWQLVDEILAILEAEGLVGDEN